MVQGGAGRGTPAADGFGLRIRHLHRRGSRLVSSSAAYPRNATCSPLLRRAPAVSGRRQQSVDLPASTPVDCNNVDAMDARCDTVVGNHFSRGDDVLSWGAKTLREQLDIDAMCKGSRRK